MTVYRFVTMKPDEVPATILAQTPEVKGLHHNNTPPTGLREVSPEEAQRRGWLLYAPAFREYRSVQWTRPDGKVEWLNLWMEWSTLNDGVALVRGPGYGNEPAVRFFVFGCDHEFETKTVGRCLHESTCKKCGCVQVIDSSD